MTIKELLNQGIIMLKNEDIDGPKNKARAILQHTLKKSKEYTIIYDRNEVTKQERENYVKNIKRLIAGEPLQYITGMQEFMKLNFIVNKDVLIPQPDTEILVEEVIKIANKMENPIILDLCTGSGAIGITLAKNLPQSKVYLSDISEDALKIAKENAKSNNVDVTIIKSDMFDDIKISDFDIIVSNPPYIEKETINNLSEEVKKEPILALDGGKTGLDYYTIIAGKAKDYLKEDGILFLEIGFNQKNRYRL